MAHVRMTTGSVAVFGMGTTLAAAIGTQALQWKGEALRWRRERRLASYLDFAAQAHRVAETNQIFRDEYCAHVTQDGLNDTLGRIANEANTLRQLQWAVRLTGSQAMAQRSAGLAERAAALVRYWGPDGFIGEYDVDRGKAEYLMDVDVDEFVGAARSEISP